jgi:hypothetical protein
MEPTKQEPNTETQSSKGGVSGGLFDDLGLFCPNCGGENISMVDDQDNSDDYFDVCYDCGYWF